MAKVSSYLELDNLFGTGIGTACVMLYSHYTRNIQAMAVISNYVVKADWIFTGTPGILQPITGFWMAHLAGYPLNVTWLLGSIIGYIITALCWFIVVYLQIKLRSIIIQSDQNNMPLPMIYTVYFKWWFLLGWPAFISLLIVFYLMVMKPF